MTPEALAARICQAAAEWGGEATGVAEDVLRLDFGADGYVLLIERLAAARLFDQDTE